MSSGGYRPQPDQSVPRHLRRGPLIRTDVVDVYVVRRVGERVEVLQLLRAREPLKGTWHPVMGHVEVGESAINCAKRELREEIGLEFGDPRLLGLSALEQVHPFFIAAIDTVVFSPRFCAEVAPGFEPRLNDEHVNARWVPLAEARRYFVWPGQCASLREISEHILPGDSLARGHLRVE
jgi:8-oxo-dGTP pyrophosphatase MutT (NUDIX family)